MAINDRRVNNVIAQTVKKTANPFNYFFNQAPRVRGGQVAFGHTQPKNKKNGR